ncbi:MAG TPA: hypothetical protein VMS18_24385 [Candidatus Binatia bacterium]|nr:hypothetical protein [Candidatus Binatia bacterium]
MSTENLTLQGKSIRLEPLAHHHVRGLVAAAAGDPTLYRWSPVPQGKTEAERYVDTALAWRDAGTAVPFAIVRMQDQVVIGSDSLLEHRAMGLAPGASVISPPCA